MQATEKKTNKIWLAGISVIATVALILGIVALVNRGDTEANSIPTINQQVDNIKNTIPELEKASTELKGYVDTLEITVETLQSDLMATNTAIDTLETEVYGEVDAENTAILNQLKADRAELEGKIDAANKAIEDAEATNAASEKAINDQITALEAELEKADADNKKALEDSITALETALTKADADNKKALEDSIAALKTVVETGDASLTTAIQTLNTNLSALIKTNADNIANLQTAAVDLQKQSDDTNTRIDTIMTELEGKISASEKKVNDELNTMKTNIQGQIATINTDITALKAKDTELEGRIAALQTYVVDEIAATEDWANATFATLEQYSAIQTEISGIRTSIETINADIEAIEKNIDNQVQEINKSIADLDAELSAEVKKVADGYTAAVAEAETDITAAYTKAIADAITASETAMKTWVNKTLADGYYDIAKTDALLSDLETKLKVADAELQADIDEQKAALNDAVKNLEIAYKKAIGDAIAENNGKISSEIAAAVKTAQDNLQTQIDTINSEIIDITSRLDDLESDVAALLAQIQSINYIPIYDDGKVKVAADESGNKYAFFDFMISPRSALAGVDEATLKNYLSMQAIYTKRAVTRGDEQNAVSFVDMEILDVTYNATTGVLTIKASGDALNADFYNADVYASAFLTVKTGETEIISDYIPMVAHSTVWVDIVTVEDWIEVTIDAGEAVEE